MSGPPRSRLGTRPSALFTSCPASLAHPELWPASKLGVFSPHVVLLDRGPNNHTATAPRELNWPKVILVLAAVAIVLTLALSIGAFIR